MFSLFVAGYFKQWVGESAISHELFILLLATVNDAYLTGFICKTTVICFTQEILEKL